MSVFTDGEVGYLREQRLGRIATVGPDGQPHVVPVGFRHNPELDTIDVGGLNLAASKKYRDVARNPLVAFVVDDVQPPWRPRGVEVRGRAEALAVGGTEVHPDFADALIRIHPSRVIGWGIETDAFSPNARSVG
jgi:pyridoxamine 5'-phosphate oxidase family protein